MWWTFNMPSDHAEVTLTDVRVPHSAILGNEGEGLACAQHFVHENRIRQAASSVGAAQFCINESVAYAKQRKTWGNYRANRLVCDAADTAIQVHGGIGYSRHKPFEHIYRHHRRYRITEGSEEIQIRKVAGTLFGFTGSNG